MVNNGTHFTAELLGTWPKNIGCKYLFAPDRHLCSNGKNKNFAISASYYLTFHELDKCVDNFSLQNEN